MSNSFRNCQRNVCTYQQNLPIPICPLLKTNSLLYTLQSTCFYISLCRSNSFIFLNFQSKSSTYFTISYLNHTHTHTQILRLRSGRFTLLGLLGWLVLLASSAFLNLHVKTTMLAELVFTIDATLLLATSIFTSGSRTVRTSTCRGPRSISLLRFLQLGHLVKFHLVTAEDSLFVKILKKNSATVTVTLYVAIRHGARTRYCGCGRHCRSIENGLAILILQLDT